MENNTWKFIENPFLSATADSRRKMDRIVEDHDAKLDAASTEPGANPELAVLFTAWGPKKTEWDTAYDAWRNARAGYKGGTVTVENLLNQLHTKPGLEEDSKIENWDNRIRAVAPRGSALYTTLLPQGRAPFSGGTRDGMINEVKLLGQRLAAQTTKPELVALGTEVSAFHTQLDNARTGQQGQEGDVTLDASEIEEARKMMARVLYGNCGMLMFLFQDTPEALAGFFALDELRSPGSPPPPRHR